MSENLWFPDVFRGFRNETLAWNVLIFICFFSLNEIFAVAKKKKLGIACKFGSKFKQISPKWFAYSYDDNDDDDDDE